MCSNDRAQPPLPEDRLDEGAMIVIFTALSKRHTGKGRLQRIVSNSVAIQGNTPLFTHEISSSLFDEFC